MLCEGVFVHGEAEMFRVEENCDLHLHLGSTDVAADGVIRSSSLAVNKDIPLIYLY